MAARPLTQIEAARQLASELAGKEGDRAGGPLRRVFAIDPTVDRTPLARLIQQRDSYAGSPGGSVRLRLFVSLMWVCVQEPYDTTRPARFWASLLGLDDPDRAGARRIRAALKELEERHFVHLQPAGSSTRVTVLNERGDGTIYLPPYEALAAHQPKEANEYFRVPTEIWTDGYLARLDGPATAMLLILLAESRGRRRGVWFSAKKADQSYGVSLATRTRGIDQLREVGLITVKKMDVNPQTRESRTRNVYEIPILPKEATDERTR